MSLDMPNVFKYVRVFHMSVNCNLLTVYLLIDILLKHKSTHKIIILFIIIYLYIMYLFVMGLWIDFGFGWGQS